MPQHLQKRQRSHHMATLDCYQLRLAWLPKHVGSHHLPHLPSPRPEAATPPFTHTPTSTIQCTWFPRMPHQSATPIVSWVLGGGSPYISTHHWFTLGVFGRGGWLPSLFVCLATNPPLTHMRSEGCSTWSVCVCVCVCVCLYVCLSVCYWREMHAEVQPTSVCMSHASRAMQLYAFPILVNVYQPSQASKKSIK